jgi:hypothetical protein
MIYMLSWRGLGVLAFFGIFVTVGFMALGSLIDEDAGFLGFSLGWVVVGIACYLIGRRANRAEPVHRFCNLKLETWGVIYGCVGLFMGLVAYRDFGARARLKQPLRPATRAVSMVDKHCS